MGSAGDVCVGEAGVPSSCGVLSVKKAVVGRRVISEVPELCIGVSDIVDSGVDVIPSFVLHLHRNETARLSQA